MVQITNMNNGRCIGVAVAEITAVPHYELLHENPNRAGRINQALFMQILTGLHSRVEPNSVTIEIFWQSRPAKNGDGTARIHQYIILRQMGSGADAICASLQEMQEGMTNDLTLKGYSVSPLDSDAEFEQFSRHLAATDAAAALAVSRKERFIPNVFYQSGLYCTDVIRPGERVNIANLTNALLQHPNSAVSLQLIPTRYKKEELSRMEQDRRILSYSSSSIRIGQGDQVEAGLQKVTDAFDYYAASEREPLFYYNFLVYAQPDTARELAGVLMANLEQEGIPDSALEVVDISAYGVKPDRKIAQSPWAISNVLVYKQRNQAYWGGNDAPLQLVRAKYLMTAREALSVFRLPIDDGAVAGLESNKKQISRQTRPESIVNNGSFKVGKAAKTGEGTPADGDHAGIALNDFSGHGLIVGMPDSGKTDFAMGLLLQFWQNYHIPFLVMESTKCEYRSLLDVIPDLQIFTPGRDDVSAYRINPFIPPRGITVERYIPGVVNAFQTAYSMSGALTDVFRTALRDCYSFYGWKADSTAQDPDATYFGLYEFVKVFRRRIRSLDLDTAVKNDLESTGMIRLISLIEQRGNIFDTVDTVPVEDLLSKPTVIELNAVDQRDQKSLLMALLLASVCVHATDHAEHDGKLRHVLLIDEAHVLLEGCDAEDARKTDSGRSSTDGLEDMIARIRSSGTGVILVDQSPTKLGKGVLENTNVKVVFKLIDKENKDAISAVMGMEPERYDLPGYLGEGEALLHYGRIYEPIRIEAYDAKDKAMLRSMIPDTEVAQRMTYWKEHQQLLIPFAECKQGCYCCGQCDPALRTEAEHIATGLANEYACELRDETDFLRFLVRMDCLIQEAAKEDAAMCLKNCVKIRFLRKVMLMRNFRFSTRDYQKILSHPKFLNK